MKCSALAVWLVPLLLAVAPARADVFEDAWACASAAVDVVEKSVTVGGKALKFVATQPDCVARLGEPTMAVPIVVVAGLANSGVLPASKPHCGNALYSTAAAPIASGLNATFGELGLLPASAQNQLVKIASGELAGQALQNIPGIGQITGSLTCGCELVEAGLSVKMIEEVFKVGDKLGNACGGEVWQATKALANEGVRQISNLGDLIAGQSPHMSYLQYFDQHWAPHVEHYAALEVQSPGHWHDGQAWREIWLPCVNYFDSHRQARATARYTCDNMRSGGKVFPERYFGRLLFQRVYEYEVSVLVENAKTQALTDHADMKTGAVLPPGLVEDSDAYVAVMQQFHQGKAWLLSDAVAQVYGVPTREKTHDGLGVSSHMPPAAWPADTLGATALAMFPQVDNGQFRADAAKGLASASQAFGLEDRLRAAYRARIEAFYAARYGLILGGREAMRDRDQESVDALVAQCLGDVCREDVGGNYARCRADLDAWIKDNAGVLGDFDSSAGKQAAKEREQRRAGCLEQAKAAARAHRPRAGGPVIQGGTVRPGIGDHVPGSIVDRETPPVQDTAEDERSARERRAAELERRRAGRQAPEDLSNEPAAPTGCSARRMMSTPRIYDCDSDEALAQCERAARGRNDISCQPPRRPVIRRR